MGSVGIFQLICEIKISQICRLQVFNSYLIILTCGSFNKMSGLVAFCSLNGVGNNSGTGARYLLSQTLLM
jgi:hypothetical protein